MTLRIERASGMTLRIESASDGPSTTIRLIGRMRSEHLDTLQAQIKSGGARIVLDLEEVSLVDIEVVRFLGKCQAAGIRLVHCALYISDWINKERSSET
jgi:anti-anti-sigma regulatory factor